MSEGLIKRPRFSKGELLLVAEAVRFYRKMIDECAKFLRKDEYELVALQNMFRNTSDKRYFDEIQELKPCVEDGKKLQYFKRSCCLEKLERRLTGLSDGHNLHSTVANAAMHIDDLVPVTNEHIEYWVQNKAVIEKLNMPKSTATQLAVNTENIR